MSTMSVQKPIIYNQLLPYSSLSVSEAHHQIEEIKQNLSKSVQNFELWPGALYWTNRLKSFLRVYGLHFSKEDHLSIIRLLFELVTIDNLESPLLYTWATVLSILLKKLKVLSRDDLALPWRPLYKVIQRTIDSKFLALGMKIYPQRTGHAVQSLVHLARNYFPVESTKEMLDEWLPLLCPFDLSSVEALRNLADFLPTRPAQEHQEAGFRLWFEKLIACWLETPQSSSTGEHLVKLFVRLACHGVGRVNWTPYLSKIFSKILRSFSLPVGRKEFNENMKNRESIIPSQAARLIVGMMDGSNTIVQQHLSTMMLSLESYYHPSNVGKHTRNLLTFLKELCCSFIARLKSERFSKPVWFSNIPASAKLTENCIDAFVQCLVPSLKLAMYSKFGTLDASTAFHRLALIRPEIVLPDLLSCTYQALETVTEPHQVTATLQCVSAVARGLLSGGMGRFPEGKRHLFSLLMLALPGIDANDFRKTIISGLLISSLVSLVPLVDSSLASKSEKLQMSEEEVEICSMTSQFENFVLQFLDRCFSLVDDTRLEQVAALDRMVSTTQSLNHESIMGLGLAGCVQIVLNQCSPELFQVALDKLYRYACGHVFESEVAGKMCADMCSAAAKVNPASSLRLFVPHCVQTIETILSDTEQLEAEHPDHNLLWHLQLLYKMLQSVGNDVLAYADPLVECLKKCVHLKSKTGSIHASRMLTNLLVSLTMTYPMESRSTSVGFSLPPEEHNYIQDWAAPGDIDNVKMEWHVPTLEELEMADKVLHTFLAPELHSLKLFMAGKEVDRDTLHQRLNLVAALISGVTAYLPNCEGEQVEGCPTTTVEFKQQHYSTSTHGKTPPSAFRREELLRVIHQLSEHIMLHCEDDTKSMFKLISIINTLLANFGSMKMDFEGKNHAFALSKSSLTDKLRGRKYDLRSLMIARAQLQHELRLVERPMGVLTQSHLTALKDLLRFSVSSYAEVRIRAQRSLSESLDMYLYSSRMILPDLLPLLKESGHISHEQFKGALHVLMVPSMVGTIVHDWNILKTILPLIIKADHSEKPSILNLMSKLVRSLITGYEYFTLKFQVPASCRQAATALSGHTVCADESQKGYEIMTTKSSESISQYSALVEELVRLQSTKLQWRHSEMGIRFLGLLIRHDYPFPVCGVKLFVNFLTHDLLAVRKLAVWAVPPILQQLKRSLVKVPVDVVKKTGVPCSSSEVPGARDSIKWLCYDPDHVPKTKEEWDSFTFVDKTHWGYYCWPKTLLTPAPSDAQAPYSRPADQLSQEELVIYDAFSSEEFVAKLIQFFSLEEVKGKDRYDYRKRVLFKMLFRNYGDSFLPLFLPHLEKLVVDTQESNQRCASEIIAGIVSGSKNWTFEMILQMQTAMERLFGQVIEQITVETVEDWGNCITDISANRDPHRLRWLFDILVKDPLHGNSGSFKDASRLYLLQSAVAQQEWRVPGLLHQVIGYLKPHLSHSFKNVRDTIGSMLSQALVCDMKVFPAVFNPTVEDLVGQLLPLLPSTQQLPSLTENEEALRLCKTVLMYSVRSFDHSRKEHFMMLAKLLPLITVEDDELGPLVLNVCSLLAHASLGEGSSEAVLNALKEGLESDLWKVRVLTLQVLQVLIFQNLFTFTSLASEVTQLLVSLLEDSQTEVRELAAVCISGFVRCGYFTGLDNLKDFFIKQSKCVLPKRNKARFGTGEQEAYELLLVKRHSGVLGLAALIEACPYSVPTWLPEVLDELALHLHDPAPIQGAVKKTLSEFRRTHHDNWSEHKQKFSDDQLAVLTDLLISPSYYA